MTSSQPEDLKHHFPQKSPHCVQGTLRLCTLNPAQALFRHSLATTPVLDTTTLNCLACLTAPPTSVSPQPNSILAISLSTPALPSPALPPHENLCSGSSLSPGNEPRLGIRARFKFCLCSFLILYSRSVAELSNAEMRSDHGTDCLPLG